MPHDPGTVPPSARGPTWKWWVCGLLLLATTVNYMDRLTLNLTARQVMLAFQMNDEHYGLTESAFAVAFAGGALLFGWMVDRWNVRWIFPAAVLCWSAFGFATGFAAGFGMLVACRFSLGLFESANWPCALRTTQRILPPAQRALGNGILQSGAALGAVVTPLLVQYFVVGASSSWLNQHFSWPGWADGWRYPYWVVGLTGLGWASLWLVSVRGRDLALPARTEAPPRDGAHTSMAAVLTDRRFWVLVVLAITINVAWHGLRAWLPLFLQKQHGYSDQQMYQFILVYYLATDAGSLCAGFAALRLVRSGWTVHGSRALVFLACTLLTALTVVAAYLPPGPVLLGLLLVIGFGSLGLFPNYYSFTQDLTVRHQGKVTGTLSCLTWLAMALFQWLMGKSVVATGSYSRGIAWAGVAPLLGFVVLLLFWKEQPRRDASGNGSV
jgi:ACS family hexuronate transporter-like MFS transporter